MFEVGKLQALVLTEKGKVRWPSTVWAHASASATG